MHAIVGQYSKRMNYLDMLLAVNCHCLARAATASSTSAIGM